MSAPRDVGMPGSFGLAGGSTQALNARLKVQSLSIALLGLCGRWRRLLRLWCTSGAGTDSEPRRRERLLVDVSLIYQNDAGTGIQRVVRNLCAELSRRPPAGHIVTFVAAVGGQPYVAVSANRIVGNPASQDFQKSVAVSRLMPDGRDVFLGLDLAPRIVSARLVELMRWRRRGVRMHFLLYDMLPALQPDWFNPVSVRQFTRWLRTLGIVCDGVVCTSDTVAREFNGWMRRDGGLNAKEIHSTVIRLGSDLGEHAVSTVAASGSNDRLVKGLLQVPFVLMVGTLEPRKAHSEVLDAFEVLWSRGETCSLVIAGRAGWKVGPIVRRLICHPERGRRLHWVDGPEDSLLAALYSTSRGLIMASKGEGFGLPLVEAQHHGKPVLARDIPIFREISGDLGVTYFSDGTQQALQQTLSGWLTGLADGSVAAPDNTSGITWSETCLQLLKALEMYE